MAIRRSIALGGTEVPPRVPQSRDYAPALPPGQMRVNESRLSGYVLKIGAQYKFFGELKQWKYLVLYADHRGPMKSGTIGICARKIFSSCVAITCCFSGLSVTFHWSRSFVAVAS